jgi:phosphoribosylamine--glycine ligase
VAPLEWDDRACVGVVLASDGYPGRYRSGVAIEGLSELRDVAEVAVFHAGTARDGDVVLTAGGRVLCVVAFGADVAAARSAAYAAVDRVSFDGAFRRSDIAAAPL